MVKQTELVFIFLKVNEIWSIRLHWFVEAQTVEVSTHSS